MGHSYKPGTRNFGWRGTSASAVKVSPTVATTSAVRLMGFAKTLTAKWGRSTGDASEGVRTYISAWWVSDQDRRREVHCNASWLRGCHPRRHAEFGLHGRENTGDFRAGAGLRKAHHGLQVNHRGGLPALPGIQNRLGIVANDRTGDWIRPALSDWTSPASGAVGGQWTPRSWHLRPPAKTATRGECQGRRFSGLSTASRKAPPDKGCRGCGAWPSPPELGFRAVLGATPHGRGTFATPRVRPLR